MDHLNHVIRSCTYKLSCLRKVSNWLNQKNLKLVVESLVLSQINYCSEIYMRLQKVRTKVQKVLNSAARLVLNRDRLQLLCSLRRLLRTKSAPKTFNLIDWSTKYGSRRRLLRLTWKWKGKHGKNAYIQSAIREWNTLKIGTKLFHNDKHFKERISEQIQSLYGNNNLK